MCRIIFRLGSFYITARPFFYIIGILLGLLVCLRINKKHKIGLTQSQLVLFHIYLGFVVHYGMQIYHYFEFIAMPVNKGRTYYGGIIAAIFYVFLMARIWRFNGRKLFDIVAISGTVGGMFTRIGCQLNGCCVGRITDSLLSVRYPFPYNERTSPALLDLLLGRRWDEYLNLLNNDVKMIPAPLYYSLGFLFILIFLYHFRSRINSNPGAIARYWLILHGILRFLIEMIRNNPPYIWGRINLSGIISIMSIVAGVILIIIRRKQFREDELKYSVKPGVCSLEFES